MAECYLLDLIIRWLISSQKLIDCIQQSETVHEHDRRREYITGFQGSSGDALVTMNKAVLWTDGRYHLQADEQLDCKWTIMKEGREDVCFFL